MFGEILIAILLGILVGIICGLSPGIHSNLVSTLTIASSPFLLNYVSITFLSVFIISMSVAQSFHDAIPSIFLGAPDESQALGVLPGHRFLLKGHGLFALKLVIIGCYGAAILSIILFPLFFIIVKYGYPLIERLIPYLILLAVLFMVYRDRNKLWATSIFIISGIFGLLAFELPIKDPLFPMLSGMFGISTMLYSINEKNNIPKQDPNYTAPIKTSLMIKSLLSGSFSGFITAVMPGLGAGMASVISSQITPGLGDVGFMMLLGSINAFNFNLSLVAYYVIDKARNGSIIAVQSILPSLELSHVLLFLSVILIVSSLCVFTSLSLGKIFNKMISLVNYRKLALCVIAFIVFLAFILSGYIGLIVLMTSTAIGFIPAIKKTTRTMSMGCLILPVLIFFFSR
jgi:putative membrane protein